MPVNVLIPTPLRKLTNELETVSASSGSIDSLIADLNSQFPGLGGRLTGAAVRVKRPSWPPLRSGEAGVCARPVWECATRP